MKKIASIEYYSINDKIVYLSSLYKYNKKLYIKRYNDNFYKLFIENDSKELKEKDVFFMDNKEYITIKVY